MTINSSFEGYVVFTENTTAQHRSEVNELSTSRLILTPCFQLSLGNAKFDDRTGMQHIKIAECHGRKSGYIVYRLLPAKVFYPLFCRFCMQSLSDYLAHYSLALLAMLYPERIDLAVRFFDDTVVLA